MSGMQNGGMGWARTHEELKLRVPHNFAMSSARRLDDGSVMRSPHCLCGPFVVLYAPVRVLRDGAAQRVRLSFMEGKSSSWKTQLKIPVCARAHIAYRFARECASRVYMFKYIISL